MYQAKSQYTNIQYQHRVCFDANNQLYTSTHHSKLVQCYVNQNRCLFSVAVSDDYSKQQRIKWQVL